MTHIDHDTGNPAFGSNGKDSRWQGRHPVEKAAIVSAAAGVVGAIIALFAWLLPVDDSPSPSAERSDPPATETTGVPSSPEPSPSPTPSPSGSPLRYLDTIPSDTGGQHLASTLPRALRGVSGYDHPIMIKCPTNQTGDKVHEVTYSLERHYLSFTANVRPYYAVASDQDATILVRALVGTRQPDDTITTVQAGEQYGAKHDRAAPLTATVEGGDYLTLSVQCQAPGGVVVLAEAGLTRAE